MRMEFKLKTCNFTADELRIIRVFFNVSTVSADEIYELGDGFMLEEHYVEHVIGDKLFVLENGYLVNAILAEENKQFLYQRTEEGLLAALLRIADPER